MSNPQAAFAAHSSLLAYWSSSACFNEAFDILPGMKTAVDGLFNVEDMMTIARRFLERSDCYYITPEIMGVLLDALPTLPNLPLSSVPVPPSGFAYLGSSIPFAQVATRLADGDIPLQTDAFAWYQEGPNDSDLRVIFFDRQRRGPGQLAISTLFRWPLAGLVEDDKGMNNPEAFAKALSLSPDEMTNFQANADEATRTIRKFLLSFFAFISQTISSVETVLPSRGLRKHSPIPQDRQLIRIVTLRKRAVGPAGQERHIDYQHRWMVQGHWRNQYYRSTRSHSPIFIAAYIKGPDGKPLLTPRTPILDVSR